MLALFFALLFVSAGVCLINFSSLNLTDNEIRLLYVEDDYVKGDKEDVGAPDEENLGENEEEPEGLQRHFSPDFEQDLEEDVWNDLREQMQSEGVDLDDKRSKEEAIRLTKEIYRG